MDILIQERSIGFEFPVKLSNKGLVYLGCMSEIRKIDVLHIRTDPGIQISFDGRGHLCM